MKDKNCDPEFLRMPVWYPVLASYTFLTGFVKLPPEGVSALAQGDTTGAAARAMLAAMRPVLASIPGNAFVGVDRCSPTDTERFFLKGGAVFSARSAWFFLANSEKVRNAALAGEAEFICLRPYRRITKPREFRLFIIDGELLAMSQYHLIRHFRRLEGIKTKLWKQAQDFIKSIAWQLPEGRLVMDIYFTASGKILIFDLNEWGKASPLMLRTYDRDWYQNQGIYLMPPPLTISGDVNVSF